MVYFNLSTKPTFHCPTDLAQDHSSLVHIFGNVTDVNQNFDEAWWWWYITGTTSYSTEQIANHIQITKAHTCQISHRYFMHRPSTTACSHSHKCETSGANFRPSGSFIILLLTSTTLFFNGSSCICICSEYHGLVKS